MTISFPASIQSGRLSLTALTAADLPLYQSLYNNPLTMQFVGPCYPPAQSALYFQHCLTKTQTAGSGWHFYTIKLRHQAKAVGLVSLIAKPFTQAPYEFGILLETTARGCGYAEEALTALFLYCFTIAKLPALLACVAPDNPGMQKHLSHFGFVNAPAALKKNAKLNSYLLLSTADTILQLTKRQQQFCRAQPAPLIPANPTSR